MESYKTIEKDSMSEIEEKHSKFICNIFKVKTVEEAEEILKQTRKKYYDSNHNCYAYIINSDVVIKKCSDDGEPSGTAGSPILNVLEKNNLYNILAIVTRYFGGTLLGAGGLIRAYTLATTKAIENANIIQKEKGYIMKINITYPNIEILKYYFNKNQIHIIDSEYKENVTFIIEIKKEQKNKFIEDCNKKTINIINYEILEEKNI